MDTDCCNTSDISDLGWFVVTTNQPRSEIPLHLFLGIPMLLGSFVILCLSNVSCTYSLYSVCDIRFAYTLHYERQTSD